MDVCIYACTYVFDIIEYYVIEWTLWMYLFNSISCYIISYLVIWYKLIELLHARTYVLLSLPLVVLT